MRYRYRCPLCGTSSRAYLTWAGADHHGHQHRDRWHDGDYPDGEEITPDSGTGESFASLPRRQQVAVVLIAAALLLAGACHRLTG